MLLSDISSALDSDSLQKSFCAISGLGFGSFGFAILAKSKKSLCMYLLNNLRKKGTMLEPVARKHSSNLYANGLVAIKVMKSVFNNPSDYLRVNEIKFILSVPSHENLLQIFNLFIDKYNGRLNIVMEPMDQNLYQFIQKNQDRPIPKWITKSILAQLLNAIRHIHANGFFHRDVKPENILVSLSSNYYGGRLMIPPDREKDLYVVKLCDYGLARHSSNMRDLTPYVSTRWYRAPEILLRLQNYSFPIDIWAFGCVAVELANRYPLFCGKNESEQLWEILKVLGHPLNPTKDDIGGKWSEGVYLANDLGFVLPFTLSCSISDILSPNYNGDLGDAIKSCFSWDPTLRPTAIDLCKKEFFHDSILSQEAAIGLTANPSLHIIDSDFESNLNYVEDCRSENTSTFGHGHSYNHIVQDVYSDPIVPLHADEFAYNSSKNEMGGTLEASYFEKFTTLGDDLIPDKLTQAEEQLVRLFDVDSISDSDSLQNSIRGLLGILKISPVVS
ncbi:CIC11C00000000571 [Sungouiella intermedia]|uniref:CIC11C00000000571 n=1 Tax=Sungouiella intermedia TaxID=45354 RepID=A0A1L0C583_9ASCO|nr:CIC11C00000000571 [[Candida] intermedia]